MPAEFNEAQVAFAELILECQLIELDVLQGWIDQLKVAPSDMGEALINDGLLKEFELTNTLGKVFNLSVASEIELEMYAVPHPLIPRELCVELLFVPMSDESPSPFPIAISNPLDEVGLNYISEQLGGLEIKVSISAPSHLRREIDACYGTEEEWEEFKAQQGHHDESGISALDQKKVEQNEESHAQHDTRSSDSNSNTLQANGDQSSGPAESHLKSNRPQTLPDWSKLANSDEGIKAFKYMLQQG